MQITSSSAVNGATYYTTHTSHCTNAREIDTTGTQTMDTIQSRSLAGAPSGVAESLDHLSVLRQLPEALRPHLEAVRESAVMLNE